jgi:hypothetical protein
MPLVPGRSKKAVAANIPLLMAEGRPQKQAVAIALNNAGMSRSSKRAKPVQQKKRRR